MRKVNKILMAIVAILLTLVLISTSLVSGIFARFVVTKQASTVVSLERFGVELKLTPNANLKSTEQKLSQAGDTISVQFTSDLLMGDTVYDALKVEVTGTPNVKVKFRFDCKVEFDKTKFTVDNSDIYGEAKGKKYMPLGFTVAFKDANSDGKIDGTEKEYVCNPYRTPADDYHIDEIITRNIAKKVCGITYDTNETPKDTSKGSYYFEKEITNEITDADNIKCFYLGFNWVTQYGGQYPTRDADTCSLVATHLAEKAAGSDITIKYTFHIEQAD